MCRPSAFIIIVALLPVEAKQLTEVTWTVVAEGKKAVWPRPAGYHRTLRCNLTDGGMSSGCSAGGYLQQVQQVQSQACALFLEKSLSAPPPPPPPANPSNARPSAEEQDRIRISKILAKPLRRASRCQAFSREHSAQGTLELFLSRTSLCLPGAEDGSTAISTTLGPQTSNRKNPGIA